MLSANFDGNVEWYFMPRGLLSVGAFSMDLKDYVAFGTETRMLYSELTNQLEEYLVSDPVNSNGQVTGLDPDIRETHHAQRDQHRAGGAAVAEQCDAAVWAALTTTWATSTMAGEAGVTDRRLRTPARR